MKKPLLKVLKRSFKKSILIIVVVLFVLISAGCEFSYTVPYVRGTCSLNHTGSASGLCERNGEIIWADSVLEANIRNRMRSFYEQFSVTEWDSLDMMPNDLDFITGDYAYGISKVDDFVHFPNLNFLNLGNGSINDITPLSNLENLETLSLGQNNISDITPLANLTNLTYLHLSQNEISALASLEKLAKLTQLHLSENTIVDIDSLASLTNLTGLGLNNNNIGNITSLAGLTKLTYLGLEGNKITDWSPVADIEDVKGRPPIK